MTDSMHPLQHYYSRIHKTYDLVNRLFTFGLDRKWRNDTVAECLKTTPSDVLDLCCGTGDMGLLLARKCMNCRITGYDFSSEMLSLARIKAADENLIINFIRGEAADMPFENDSFDCITIGFGFRNLVWENPQQEKHLAEIFRVLKIGGSLLILESAVPQNNLIRFLYRVYLKWILIPLGGLLSGDWKAYRYLAGSSAGFYSYQELQQMMMAYGLHLSLQKKYLFGSVNMLVAVKTAIE